MKFKIEFDDTRISKFTLSRKDSLFHMWTVVGNYETENEATEALKTHKKYPKYFNKEC